MNTCKYIISVISIFLLSTSLSLGSINDNKILERGRAALENGDVDQALNIWEQALENSDYRNIDPRIGFSYIRTAVRHNKVDYYEKANRMYFLSYNREITEDNFNIFKDDLIYLNTIYEEEDIYSEVKKNLPTIVFKELKTIWHHQDPTPRTAYNERLIEHWKRIIHIEETYADGLSKNVVEQDDRAKIYLKYGNPLISRDGQFVYNSAIVQRLIRERLYGTAGPTSADPAQAKILSMIEYDLQNKIRLYHQIPYYEVWTYDNPDALENSIYIFGSSNGVNRYELKRAVEDFIPSVAFSYFNRNNTYSISRDINTSGNNSNTEGSGSTDGLESLDFNSEDVGVGATNVTPGLILQIMYYEQLTAVDRFFNITYENMLNSYLDLTLILSPSFSQVLRHTNRSTMVEYQSKMPENLSELPKQLGNIDLEVYTYQFLDENNIPYVISFMNSYVYESLMADFVSIYGTGEQGFQNYEVKHSMFVYSETDDLLDYSIGDGILDVNLDDNEAKAVSIGRVYLPEGANTLSLSSELLNTDNAINYANASREIFNKELRALGELERSIDRFEDTDDLLVSDIVIGFDRVEENVRLPFTVSHDRILKKGENLLFYFEIYNLALQANGFYNFKLDYEIAKKSRGLFRRNNNDYAFSASLNFIAEQNRYGESIEIESDVFETGSTYVLYLTFTDMASKKIINKEIEFKVQ